MIEPYILLYKFDSTQTFTIESILKLFLKPNLFHFTLNVHNKYSICSWHLIKDHSSRNCDRICRMCGEFAMYATAKTINVKLKLRFTWFLVAMRIRHVYVIIFHLTCDLQCILSREMLFIIKRKIYINSIEKHNSCGFRVCISLL